MSLTPKQYEQVAWSLDVLSQLSRSLLEPLAMMDDSNAATLDVTVRLTRGDRPMTSDEAKRLLEWLDGDEMQQDLRAEARRES